MKNKTMTRNVENSFPLKKTINGSDTKVIKKKEQLLRMLAARSYVGIK